MAVRYIHENPSAYSLEGMFVVLGVFRKSLFTVRYEVPEIQLCRRAVV